MFQSPKEKQTNIEKIHKELDAARLAVNFINIIMIIDMCYHRDFA